MPSARPVLCAGTFTVAGLKFGLVIGIGAGLLSFIPYVGALVGGVVAIGVGLVQFWPDYTSIAIIIGIFAVGQFIEGNFLSPKLVGGSDWPASRLADVCALCLRLRLWFCRAACWPFRLAAAAGVLVRFALNKYLASKLYRGVPREMPTPRKTSVRNRAK